jgi:hypothetical protein
LRIIFQFTRDGRTLAGILQWRQEGDLNTLRDTRAFSNSPPKAASCSFADALHMSGKKNLLLEMGVSSVEMGGEVDKNGQVIRSANDANYTKQAAQV